MWGRTVCLFFCLFINGVPAKLEHSVDGRPSLRQNEEKDCWLNMDVEEHFQTMEALEAKHDSVRHKFDTELNDDQFDEEVLGTILADQGATNRETQKHNNRKNLIPSGLNLGGYSMMRMPDSVMFFHRMKVRNDTRFRMNYLRSNFTQMTMVGRLALNDLHLVGSYERTQTQKDEPSLLYYTPSYGEVEFLLKNVLYKIEGRYRLQKDRLFLEIILSELYLPHDGILMSYRAANSSNREEPKTLHTKNIADFLDRMKTDLDLWLKDFFNEFFMDHPLVATPTRDQFQQYDKERIGALNNYVDHSLELLKQRLETLRAIEGVSLPNFSIFTFNGLILHLTNGVLIGLDTIYRRSMATNKLEKDVRKVDVLVAFSNLKVRYNYEVRLTTGAPPLSGTLILSGDQLSAIMSLSMVKDPAFVDLKFDFLQYLKPESLTVEGAVGRVITNFKHILELHIIAIMSNAMIDQVKQLRSLSKCVPTIKSALTSVKNRGYANLEDLDEDISRQRMKRTLKGRRFPKTTTQHRSRG